MLCIEFCGDRRLLIKKAIACLFDLLTKTLKLVCTRSDKFGSSLKDYLLLLLLICLWPVHAYPSDKGDKTGNAFFILENGIDLREFGGENVRKRLVRIKGQGNRFGERQQQRYCRIKHAENVQWALNNLETGELIASSTNAGEVFFGASVAKVFVAAALLHKQNGNFTQAQL